MKKSISLIFLLSGMLVSQAFAELPSYPGNNDGRYKLFMMEGRGIKNVRVPAMILDSVRGIIWTCQNLQDGRPLWVKADLGRNGKAVLTKKKYVAKMLMWQDSDLRMPAIVLDTELGVVWTCQNIIDGKAIWVQRDLTSGVLREITREEVGVVLGDAEKIFEH